jgi:hypothetical protein
MFHRIKWDIKNSYLESLQVASGQCEEGASSGENSFHDLLEYLCTHHKGIKQLSCLCKKHLQTCSFASHLMHLTGTHVLHSQCMFKPWWHMGLTTSGLSRKPFSGLHVPFFVWVVGMEPRISWFLAGAIPLRYIPQPLVMKQVENAVKGIFKN